MKDRFAPISRSALARLLKTLEQVEETDANLTDLFEEILQTLDEIEQGEQRVRAGAPLS